MRAAAEGRSGGALASLLPAANSAEEAAAHSAELLELLRGLSGVRLLDAQAGREIDVLVERGGMGRAADFTPVAMPGAKPGTLISARVAGHDGTRLLLL
jgi:threonylcarbamoyladenosine tRNA methylthiotransferase MtaB